MCQSDHPDLHSNACTLAVGALIVIRGEAPATISNGTIIIFRPFPSTPDYLVVHRVMKIVPQSSSPDGQYDFFTRGDANPTALECRTHGPDQGAPCREAR